VARKRGTLMRSVTFRMPADRYAQLADAAAARGIDMSAILNLLLSGKGESVGRIKTEGASRQVGFRMPQGHFDVLAAVAEARGVDLSAVLNQLAAEALPALRAELERLRAPAEGA